MFTKIVFNGQTIDNIPAGFTVEQAREAVKTFYPEVSNASYTIEDGVLTFRIKAQEKGLA